MKSTSKSFKALLGGVMLAFSLVALLPVAVLAQTVSFDPATNYAVGTDPRTLAIGDLNGDGKLDLAVANYGACNYSCSTVSILLGDGTGTFGGPTDVTALGSGPTSVAIGDLNGDGNLDLAVTTSDGVSILLGTGTGSFGAATNFAFGASATSVAIGDLNSDGKPDLATANYGSNNVSILLGTGTGSFGAATTFAVGSNPFSVAIGDLNGDGKPDLAVANHVSNNVSILLGTGTGSFGSANNFAAGAGANSVAIGDLNGDGKPDLATTNFYGNTVSILVGDSAGSFGPPTNFAVGSNTYSVAIGDLNGDGKPDLAVANSGSGNVSILLGTGTGSFDPATNFAAGTAPIFVAVGDFNGDGKLDLATGNYVSPNVTILLNTTVFPPPPVGTLTSIAVTPTDPTISVGQTQQFTATGTFSDGTSQALTGGQWSSLASMPTARSYLQGAAANGLLYAVGGNDGRDTPIVEAYNPASNTWSAVASLNAPNYGGDTGRYQGSAVGVNGKIYMMGGWTNSPPLPSNTLSIYDPSTNAWTSGPTIPGSGFTGCSQAAAIGSKIYLLNACNGFSGYVQQLSIFDTVTNSWTTGPNAPRNHNGGLAAALNGKFYVTGGTDGTPHPEVDVYDPATNAWTTVGNMPVNLWSMTGDVIDGKWYIVGGSDPTTNYKDTVWIYDPAVYIWTSGPTAPTARNGATAATINGKLYVVGGNDSTGNLGTLEVFDPNASGASWSSDNTAVATVDATGLATAVGAGSANITATSGSISDSTTLTVVNPNQPPVANAGPDQVVEAASAAGASVTLDGSGSSDPDGDTLTYTWTGPFGTASGVSPTVTVPLGASTITLSVDDGNGHTTAATTSVTVQDTTPPLISGAPADIVLEATNPVGAVASWASPTAADLVDGVLPVSCAPASGSTFVLGNTPVTCSATDAHGNAASVGFNVTVQDTTRPTIDAHGDVTVEATSATGALVNYTSPASHDLVDGDGVASCAPASGSQFALGNTTVNCTATDAQGNAATPTSFTVHVVDTTPPTLLLPANFAVNATSPSGAVVTYNASAVDLADPNPILSCAPASGTLFGNGTTTVVCTATDSGGNTSAPGSFVVTVNGAAAQIEDLVALVDSVLSVNAQNGIQNSLDAKLQNALAAINSLKGGNVGSAINQLDAFISAVQAQSGKAIPVDQANQLIAAAQQVKAALGAP